MPLKNQPLNQNILLFSILLLSAFLVFFRLDFQSLWMDEVYTMNVSSPEISFSDMTADLMQHEGFPHFYYFVLRLLYILMGYSAFTVRLFSAVAALTSVYYIYLVGKELFNKNSGLVAALLLSLNSFHIYYAQEARPYSLYLLATIASVYYLIKFIKDPNRKHTLLYGISIGLLININFFGLFNIFAQILVILFLLLVLEKENAKKLFINSLWAGLIFLLLFLPNVPKFLNLLKLDSFWVPRPEYGDAAKLSSELLGKSEIIVFCSYLLVAYYLFTLFFTRFKNKLQDILEDKKTLAFIILVSWFSIYFYVIYIKSLINVSVFLSRYFVCVLPAVILLITAGISSIRNSVVRNLMVICFAFICLVELVAVKKYYSVPGKSQYREVSSYITQNNKGNNTVYTSLKYIYNFYLNTEKAHTDLHEKDLNTAVGMMMADSTQIKSFWYADAHGRPYNATPEVEEFLQKHFILDKSFEGFDAWCRHYKTGKNMVKISDKDIVGEAAMQNSPYMQNVEMFDYKDNKLKTSGWCCFKDIDSDKTEIALFLVNNGANYALPTQNIFRKDVTSYFNLNYNAGNSGYSCDANLAGLPAGTYTFAVYMVNKPLNKKTVLITDKTIEIK